MDISKYLSRINYRGKLSPTLKVLQALQNAHLLAVPFENLDIHLNRIIELDVEKLFDKIVIRNRGGFCYELNGLFFELLKTIGFDAKMVSARVYDSIKGYGPEFDHMAIIVRINDVDYLTDVGFGEFTNLPLEINLDKIQHDERGKFIIEQYDKYYFKVSKETEEKWIPQYIFSFTKRELSDFNGMCLYHQTSPDSHFTQKRICSVATKNGRITLTGNILKIREGSTLKEESINKNLNLESILIKYFNIKL